HRARGAGGRRPVGAVRSSFPPVGGGIAACPARVAAPEGAAQDHRPHRYLHRAGLPLPDGERADHELSPAAKHAAAAHRRVYRAGVEEGVRLRAGARFAVPELWGWEPAVAEGLSAPGQRSGYYSVFLREHFIMSTSSIRQKLHNYLEVAADEKVEALYVIMQQDVEATAESYSPEFRAELDRRYAAYLSDKRNVVSAAESKSRIDRLMRNKWGGNA